MAVKSLFCSQLDNYLQSITPELSNETRFFKIRPFHDRVASFEIDLYSSFSLISKIIAHNHNDVKKESRSQTVSFFESCCNFLSKSGKKVKFGKSVRLRLESMKKGFGINFCHSRACVDPMKYHKSQKNGVFSRLRVTISENRPFLAGNFGARTLDLFLSKNVFLGP